MSKVLLTSDVHVDDWIQYSPTPDYRLNEYDFLGLRYVYLINQHNCPWIFFCGDTINRPDVSPKAFHKVSNIVINILNNTNANIGFICGQHDLDSKMETVNISDTYITTLCNYNPNRVYYLHDRYVTVDDKLIYCSNYIPIEEYVLPKEVDVFLGHVSLGFGQTISGKRKISFCGDIHTVESHNHPDCLLGDHTLGTPVQLYPDQMPNGGIITLLDMGDLSFERIPTSGELPNGGWHSFLNLKDTDDYKDIINKQLEGEEYEKLLDAANSLSSKSINLMADIEENVKSQSLEHIHNMIDKSRQPMPISFNFKIRKLIVDNFKSIKHLELNFDELQDIVYISAVNGVGKSVLLTSILIALVGDRSMSAYNHDPDGNEINTIDCRLDITLEYGNKLFRIVRGPGLLEFYINNEIQSKNNKRELNAMIYQYLPFISYVHFFFLQANRHLFESCDRLEFFKVCFNLNVYDYYAQECKELQKSINRDIRDLNTKIKIEDDIKSNTLNMINDITSKMSNYPRGNEDTNVLTKNIDTINNLDKLKSDIMTKKGILSVEIEHTEKQCEYLSSIPRQDLVNELNNLIELNQYNIAIGKHQSDVRLLTDKINTIQSTIGDGQQYLNMDIESEYQYLIALDKYNTEVTEYNRRVEELNRIIARPINSMSCPHCNQNIILDDEANKMKEDAITELNRLASNVPVPPNPVAVNFSNVLECTHAMKIRDSIIGYQKELDEANTQMANLNNSTPVKPVDIPKRFNTEVEYNNLISSIDNLSNLTNIISEKKSQMAELIDRGTEVDNTIYNILTSGDTVYNDIQEYISDMTVRIKNATEYAMLQKQLTHCQSDIEVRDNNIQALNNEIDEKNKLVIDCIRYYNLFDASNLESIPNKMLTKIAENLSSDEVKVITSMGSDDDNSSYFYVSLRIKDATGTWRNYDAASDGQKVLMDMYLLNKIIFIMGKVGILVLDESLANLSESTFRQALSLINTLSVTKCFITSHNPSMVILGDKLELVLDKDQGTKIINNSIRYG